MAVERTSMLRLLMTLVARVKRESLPWETLEPYVYSLSSPSGRLVLISSRDRDDRQPFALEITDTSGANVVDVLETAWEHDPDDAFDSVASAWNADLEYVYFAARASALGIDAAVDEFVQFLSMDEEPF